MKTQDCLKKALLSVAGSFIALGFGLSVWEVSSIAGVFNLPHYVPQGEFAIGMEPEVYFSSGATAGINLKYTHGISELNNLMGIIGTGGSGRAFRVGGAITFDIFPDIDKQPGIGVGFQSLYLRMESQGVLEATAIPYIHKNLMADGSPVEPFLAVPFGLSLSDGVYKAISTLAFGAIFTHNEHFKSIMEFGVGINNTNTYISGGVTYYH